MVLLLAILAGIVAVPAEATSQVQTADAKLPVVKASQLEAAPTWEFHSSPALEIASPDGPAGSFERISAVMLHRDGYLVADMGGRDILFFDRTGSLLGSARESGAGAPFGQPTQVAISDGDSVYVWDLPRQRLTVLDPALEPVRSVDLSFPVFGFVVASVFASGELLVWPFARAGSVSEPVVVESVSAFAVASSDGGPVLDTIFTLPSRPAQFHPDGSMLQVPFTVQPSYAMGEAGVWAGSGETGIARRYRSDGTISAALQFPPGPRVTNEMVAEERRRQLARIAEGARDNRERRLQGLPLPTSLPAFDLLRVDSEGRLWVRRFRSSDQEVQDWRILSANGEPVGKIELPAEFHLHAIGRDRLVGTKRQASGGVTVQVHRYSH